MRAAVMRGPGGPEVLKVESLPVPTPKAGEVLIEVKAFGLNRSELFTRQGHSPGVTFPRVLGIEAVGVVAAAPGGQFTVGEKVATAMGGMGRQFDGGYAEYTCVPATQVQRIASTLPWEVLGALPEMLQTAWGALTVSLSMKPGDRLLIRGGTTSIGLAAAAIAKSMGVRVASTTRNAARAADLEKHGAEQVFIDDGDIAEQVRAWSAGGVDHVLELIGTTTLLDSLECARRGGTVNVTGIVGNAWSLKDFQPMDDIPTGVRLTVYGGGPDEFMATPLQSLIEQIEAGTLAIPLGKTFRLEQIAGAHAAMEANLGQGKLVVVP